MAASLFREQVLDRRACDEFMAGHCVPSEEDMNVRRKTGADMLALAYAAASAIENHSIPKASLLGSGSCNSVYLLIFPDGSEVIARIPYEEFRIPARLQSEVATMTFARYYCGIPCPKVFAWHPLEDNIVGTPYILMEKARGKPVLTCEGIVSYDWHLKLLESLAKLHAIFACPLPFSSIGSVFFSPSAIAGNTSTSDLSDLSLYEVRPYAREPAPGMGPWNVEYPGVPTSSIREFWNDFIEKELAATISRWGKARKTIILPATHTVPGLRQRIWTMGKLLNAHANLRVLVSNCALPQDPNILSPCLVPSDYAYRNIFIDPETLEVTSFLDWDSVSVMPFLLCTRFPEDITWCDGAPSSWYSESGGFEFVPCEEPPEPGDYAPSFLESQRYRHYYKDRLLDHDKRFTPELWRMREDPLKIHYLVTHGWAYWLAWHKWLYRRVKACRRANKRSSS